MQKIKDATNQKLRGGYYTPPAIADFILRWGMSGKNHLDILEPSCGDGAFLECLANAHVTYDSITAVEYEAGEAEKARAITLANSEVITGDFHQFCLETNLKFDLIIGNPPFIRYQYYDKGQQSQADQIFAKAKLKRSKQSNAWVTFVVGSTLLLRDKGRMGFVIPSELLMVKYAQQLRRYLSQTFNKINIISFKELVFDEIQQDVVLLLCERDDSKEYRIEHIEVKDITELLSLDPSAFNAPTKKINFHTDKWTYYFLDSKELALLEKIKTGGETISTFANIEVGITTGANDYFTVPNKIVQEYQLSPYAYPMVGRSVQVSGLSFTTEDWEENVKMGAKAYLLAFPSEFNDDDVESIRRYIMYGEKLGIHKGYKTGVRERWWVVPSIKLSDAFFLRRNNIFPKFVLNEAGAYTTDTMHRVFIKEGVNKKAFIASYYNSLSFAFSEIQGRNFGGGCLELMPTEVGQVYLPYRVENEQLFEHIDALLRAKATAEQILDFTDDIILRRGMGLSIDEVQLARSVWNKIRNRRLGR
ncbi:MAG: class I SAM-dependent methyltransferase [Porphyromonadaceae bacterium]|nr:class I SAM-dependent methyltransferase [Porphyromonadaceae bacterium]